MAKLGTFVTWTTEYVDHNGQVFYHQHFKWFERHAKAVKHAAHLVRFKKQNVCIEKGTYRPGVAGIRKQFKLTA